MRIGVTGIFASGKGTVCSIFKDLGAIVIDTDILAREIVMPGSPALDKIKNAFGDDYFNEDGSLQRREFAQYVFDDPQKVETLNGITHPAILDIMMNRSSDNEIYMIDTPLLFESGFDTYMDKTIVVKAQRSQAVNRGVKRDGITAEEIENRLKFQIPLNEKEKRADYVIDNSESLDNTKRQVVDLWKILKELQEK